MYTFKLPVVKLVDRHKKTILTNTSNVWTILWKLLLAGKLCRMMPVDAGTARKLSPYGDAKIVCWPLHYAGHVCNNITEKTHSTELKIGMGVTFARLLYLRLAHIL